MQPTPEPKVFSLATPRNSASAPASTHSVPIMGHPPWSALLSQALLFLLIAGMAGSCDAALFWRKIAQPRAILAGLFAQFVVLPLLGFAAITLIPQSAVTTVTLLVVTTSPGGGFSGWWCSLCNADLALSVAMTTASTLACTVLLPLNLYIYVDCIYGSEVDIDWSQLLLSVVVVVTAVGVGLFASYSLPSRRTAINQFGSLAGVCLMLLGFVSNTRSNDPIWDNSAGWFAAVSLPCVGGLVVALTLSRCIRLAKEESVAVAIECCYQNTGLALTIALSAFPPSEAGAAAGVPLLYGMSELVLIPAFALIAWKCGLTYAPATEPLCVALAGNYQPVEKAAAPPGARPAPGAARARGGGGAKGRANGASVRQPQALV